ncbi:Dam family site-specific DNA-(adenine-N6)-methyltransferase [Gammaproteobacteria bacterium]|nr:Dam family site-specific DNA-(adenine-N6)-methyltransferase [Gammaproteobacteria bacterium]
MIIKWAGGKRWLYKNHSDLFDLSNTNNYIEPFLGGGSIFFSLRPKKSLLSDINPRLIDFFESLKANPEELFYKTNELIKTHSKDQYYLIRNKLNDGDASPENFLYLNRTCFNGIYRENLKGEFNVPIGIRNSSYLPFTIEDFKIYSTILRNSTLRNEQFYEALNRVKHDDFIFVDPPYIKNINNYESFNKYRKDAFTKADLYLLAEILESLSGTCKILISNFDLENVKILFPNWNKKSVKQMSYLSGAGKGRKEMEEVLIYNY